MASLGGKRKGAGRKKGMASVTAEAARAYMVKEIAKRMPALMKSHFALALGHYEERVVAGKRAIVYTVPPEQKAVQYLTDQAAGKAKESIEHSGSIKTLIIDF